LKEFILTVRLHIMQLNCNFVHSIGFLPAGIFKIDSHAIPFNRFSFMEEEWPDGMHTGQSGEGSTKYLFYRQILFVSYTLKRCYLY
jgi:hypothetical protein